MPHCLNGLPRCLTIVRHKRFHSHSCFHMMCLTKVLWPPPKENLLFTAQAAALWMLYYTVRILIYRPFISFSTGAPYSPSENDASSFPYPAMEICVEAARSCARIVEAVAERGLSNVPALMNIAHISATMLLVKVWDLKAQDKSLQAQGIEDLKPPVVQRIEPFMADVNMLIHVLERAQFRWGFVSSFLSVFSLSI